MFWRGDGGQFELRREIDGFDLYKQFNLPVDDSSYHHPNCNGMVCLRGESGLMLWNPAIRKSVNLPESNLFPNLGPYISHIAFWFDSLTKDYKVIRIYSEISYKTNDPPRPPLVEIFSLNNNHWKDVSEIAPYFAIDPVSPSVFNGMLNWIGRVMPAPRQYGKHSILSFDVNAQVFGTIELPYILTNHSQCLELSLYKETSIAVCSFVYDRFDGYINGPCHTEVWVMKDYGNVESWTKLWIYDKSQQLPLGAIVGYGFPPERGLGLLNNGQVLWELRGSTQPNEHPVSESKMIISTDPETGLHKQVAVFPKYYFSRSSVVTYFEESLALLDSV